MISSLRVAISTLLVVGIALHFGDRVGFEGDDLAIIAGVAHFDWRPLDSLYRPDWQPLSYALARLLVSAGLPPLALTYLPNVLGGIGLVLLAEALRALLKFRHRTLVAYALVLSIPELWISVLYFNTTAIGLPFFCGSLLLLSRAPGVGAAESRRLIAAAMLFAVSCLMRLDFLVASPAMLLVVSWSAKERVQALALFILAGAATGCALLFALDVGVMDIVRGSGQLEDLPWPAWRSAMVLALALLPLALAAPLLAWELHRRGWPRPPPLWWTAIVPAALVAWYPLHLLYSGKYLLPAFCLGLFALAMLLGRAGRGRSALVESNGLHPVTLWSGAGILLLVYLFGVQVDRPTGALGVSWQPTTFNTHDGVRPLAGFLSMLPLMRDPERRPIYIILHRRIAEWLERAPEDAVAVLVGDDSTHGDAWSTPLMNYWEWGWAALPLQGRGWSVEFYSLRGRITLRSADGRRVSIVRWQDAAHAGSGGRCRIRIGPVRFGAAGYADMEYQSERLARAPCAADI